MASYEFKTLSHTAAEVDQSIDDTAAHIANTTIHVTAADKTSWDAKPSANELSSVAFSGSYDDLSGKPTIDSILDAQSTNAIQNAAVFAALLGFFPLTLATEIPSTFTALNQIKQAGVFCKLSGFNSAFSDLPANWGTCAAGNLIVLPTAVSWRFRQILLPSAMVGSPAAPVPYFWMRYMTGGTASDPSGAQYRAWIEFGGTILS